TAARGRHRSAWTPDRWPECPRRGRLPAPTYPTDRESARGPGPSLRAAGSSPGYPSRQPPSNPRWTGRRVLHRRLLAPVRLHPAPADPALCLPERVPQLKPGLSPPLSGAIAALESALTWGPV